MNNIYNKSCNSPFCMPNALGYENMYGPFNICPYCSGYGGWYNMGAPWGFMNQFAPNTWPNMGYGKRGMNELEKEIELKDYGANPFVININEATLENTNYRTAIWTGKYLQATLMKIDVGDDVGLEIHPNTDQFLRIEEGQGIVKMGKTKDNLDFEEEVKDDYAIFVPAGTWHNVVNTGYKPIKLYSIYAPPHHPHGTIHKTKMIAEMEEGH